MFIEDIAEFDVNKLALLPNPNDIKDADAFWSHEFDKYAADGVLFTPQSKVRYRSAYLKALKKRRSLMQVGPALESN